MIHRAARERNRAHSGRAGLDCPPGVREDLIAKHDETIARSGKLSATKRAGLRGKISMLPGLNRFLRVIRGGLFRVDKTKASAEALGRLHWSVYADYL